MPAETNKTSKCDGAVQEQRLALGLCLLFVLAFGVLWLINLDEPFSQDYDEGVYLSSARMALHGHPLFTSVFSSQPPAFLEILASAFYLFGDSVVVGRCVIILFSLVSLVAAGRIAWQVARPMAGPVAILLLGLSLLFFRQATIVQAEIPALAFALLAIAILAREKPRGAWLIGAGFCFTLGALCKLLVVPMLVPIIMLLLAPMPAPEPIPSNVRGWLIFGRQFTARVLAFVLGCAAACALILSPWSWPAMYDQIIVFHLQAKSHYPPDWSGNLAIIVQVFDQDFVLPLLAVPGLLFLCGNRLYHVLWLSLWILATAMFLVDHTPLFPRHVLLLLPPLAVAAAANVLWIGELLTQKRGEIIGLLLLVPCALILGFSLDQATQLIWAKTGDSSEDREIVRLLEANTRPSDFIVSDQQMQVFRAGRRVPPELCDTSLVRIKSGYLTDQQAIDSSRHARVIVFWTRRLAQLPLFCKWVESNYEHIPTSGGSRSFFLKKGLVDEEISR